MGDSPSAPFGSAQGEHSGRSGRAANDGPPSLRAAVARGVALVALILLLHPQPLPLAIPQAFLTAQEKTVQKEYAAAAEALEDAAARLPYDGYVAYRAGIAEISAKHFDAAVRHLLVSAALEGWTPNKRIALGDAYLGQGDRAVALAQWELARKDEPDDDGLLVRLANNYEAVGRYPEAIAALTRLADLRRTDSLVHYRLALLTAATSPTDALARLTLVASLSADLAPNAQALSQAIEAGRATGDEAYTFGRVGFAFVQLKEWGLAELALTRATMLDSSYADAYAYLGLAQDMQSKDGLAANERAITLAPQSPLAQYLIGLHWRRAGNSEKALPYLKQAQALDPQNPAVAAEIGGAYASLNDLAQAETWLTEAVRIAPQSPQFWLLLARFYTDNEYHVAELGLPAARMAAGLNPSSALAADALGYALVLTRDPVNGEKALERALTLDPNLPSLYYHFGVLYAAQGKITEAKAAFNHTLALDPQGPYGGLALKALAQIAP
jgi:tetratricopeptide (TPR) repeat protein